MVCQVHHGLTGGRWYNSLSLTGDILSLTGDHFDFGDPEAAEDSASAAAGDGVHSAH